MADQQSDSKVEVEVKDKANENADAKDHENENDNHNNHNDNDDEDAQTEDAQTEDTPAKPPVPDICVICLCARGKSLREVRCGHKLCVGCITEYFESSVYTVPFKPPQCCGEHLPMAWAREYLRPKTRRAVRDRVGEMRDHEQGLNTAYCIFCGTWIPSRHRVQDMGLCACGSRICLLCGDALHQGETCAEAREKHGNQTTADVAWDVNVKEMERLGCRYCPFCLVAVEKVFGCNWIECSACDGYFEWNKACLVLAGKAPPAPRVRPPIASPSPTELLDELQTMSLSD